jgi:hypothetical protein
LHGATRRAEKTRHLKLLIVRDSLRASKAGIRICYILVSERCEAANAQEIVYAQRSAFAASSDESMPLFDCQSCLLFPLRICAVALRSASATEIVGKQRHAIASGIRARFDAARTLPRSN